MKLVVDKASLVSVADAIRTKGNTTDELEFPNGFVDGINAIESGGGTEEIENFWYETSKAWDNNFRSMFYKSEKIITAPKLNFENAKDMRYFAGYSTLQSVDYYIDSVNSTDFYQAFMECKNLKTIVGINTSNATNVYEMFKQCSLLETIQEPLDFSKVVTSNRFGGVFVGCSALKNVKFTENSLNLSIQLGNCSLLTDDSIKSILRGLAYVDATQTLKLHVDVYNKLLVTDDEELYALYDEALIDKGWDIAY